jgi:rubrerythrin
MVAANSDILRVLEIARDIELYCAEVYKYFSEIFADDFELSNLWRKTALEEENHANQFVMAINLRRMNMVEAVCVELQKAENTLLAIKSFYDKVRLNKPTAIDALRNAITIEEKLSDFHMTSIALFIDDNFKKLFTAMMKADDYHLEKIKNEYQKRLY